MSHAEVDFDSVQVIDDTDTPGKQLVFTTKLGESRMYPLTDKAKACFSSANGSKDGPFDLLRIVDDLKYGRVIHNYVGPIRDLQELHLLAGRIDKIIKDVIEHNKKAL